MADDIDRLRRELAPVAEGARELHWADKRPWTPETHVFWESSVPTIDLHDLNAKLAKMAVNLSIETEPEAGAIFYITGRGRHSLGPGVLGGVVKSELKKACKGKSWSFRPSGPARYVLITDRNKAPGAATGALGPLFWLFAALLVAGIAAVIWNTFAAG